ncbi:MAG TPA: sigma-54 dependent transcriptional regulator [Pyrinomonadaceae bacterium]|jgi:DNA-binding NtrC family response regulator
MRERNAVLLNALDETSASSSAALRAILQPYFAVAILPQPRISEIAAAKNVFDRIRDFNPVIVFLVSLRASTNEIVKLLGAISQSLAGTPIIPVIDEAEPRDVFQLLRGGAPDFLTTPLRSSDVLPRTWRVMRSSPEETDALVPAGVSDFQHLIGRSPDFIAQVQRIPLLAKCDVNVLLAGETGTGKEVYARTVHYQSPRASKPFLPVNCGAIPFELVENELFGHERGAYTNASAFQAGLIEEANGGTLFLDEIDCLPLLSQVKLLRFLQEKEYKPLGSSRTRRADVRIIAASNLDLQEAVGNGKLRQDLFYRLNTISLTLPPLRERREDIPLLALHFLNRYAVEFGKRAMELSTQAFHRLTVYDWPGNVRELEHVIERAVVLCDGSVLEASDLVLPTPVESQHDSLQQAKAKEIARFEKNYIQGLLSACRGNITRAAQVAKKNRRAFWELIRKHKIDVEKFRSSTS